ncbi:hypothetical protein [Phorcysia thermohydrogeniphila]|uniref:Uncharacterized protein n=1 Tax=Phorcysia thermohydrogeniphila TaxID=936138 RepID=A0A4R1GCP1_9BACT|nr:hypothetical protein [Phorcysia thermohydrogeniphila]TCK03469.1 hypothetical protein CLV27_1547 [Phorcysia thermohydrogeniphila]
MEVCENIGKNGQIYFYSEFCGSFSRSLHGFFVKAVKAFAGVSMNFVRKYDDFPFVYGEKALPSVLIPAFKEASDSGIVFSEYPVDRKKVISRIRNEKDNCKLGRVDYLVFHKGKEILIETKLSWVSYNSLMKEKGIVKRHVKLLGRALEQIRSIKWGKEEESEKVAFMVVPVYYPSNTIEDFKKNIDSTLGEKLFEESYHELLAYIKNFLSEFQPFVGYWVVPTPHEYYIEWERRFEAYPYVFFIGGRV